MRSGPEIAVEIVRPALVAASDARPSPLGRDARRVVNKSRLGALDAGAIATEALLFQTGDLGAGRRITAARALAAGAGNESHLGFHDMFSSTCLPSPLGRKLVRSPPHTGFLTLPEAATRRHTQVSHAPSRCCHELPARAHPRPHWVRSLAARAIPVPVLHPFPNVAQHVVQTEHVRSLPPHRSHVQDGSGQRSPARFPSSCPCHPASLDTSR